jgi:glutamate---cysteine ligase / carboxylate-amine ligase
VHALAARLAAAHDTGEAIVPAETWRIEENRWHALRRGPDGQLADLETGAVEPTRRRLHALIDRLEADAQRLGAGPQLARARDLVEQGGAARQRAAGGPREAAAWLAESFLDAP